MEEEFMLVSVGCRMVTVKKHQHFNEMFCWPTGFLAKTLFPK